MWIKFERNIPGFFSVWYARMSYLERKKQAKCNVKDILFYGHTYDDDLDVFDSYAFCLYKRTYAGAHAPKKKNSSPC